LPVIFMTFGAHVRFLQRRLYEVEDKQALHKVINALKSHAAFADFITCNGGLLHVRQL
jgi:hypothetical protein